MKKEEVQQRVLQNGKPLDLDKFEWNEKTKTFSSEENNLVFNFSDICYCTFNTISHCTFYTNHSCMFNTYSNCIFNTGYNCVFRTGSNCTFKTGWNCIFDTSKKCNFETAGGCIFNTYVSCNFSTGSGCIFKTAERCNFKTNSDCNFETGDFCSFDTSFNCFFKTGRYCNFKTGCDCIFNIPYSCKLETGNDCVVITNHTVNLQIIKTKKDVKYQIAPLGKYGYLKDGIYSKTGKPAIICDSILTHYTNKKVVKGLEIYKIKGGYIVKKGDVSAHGETIKKCLEDLKFKISNRDTSKYENYTLDTIVSQEDAIKMYRIITGACEFGTKSFCSSIDLKDEYSIKEIIDITKGQYGNENFKSFFINKGVKND